MGFRTVVSSFLLGAALTLASGHIPGRTSRTYSEIMGCEQGCEVAAGGFPIAFIADYPGLSPVNSADTVGALMGVDHVLWPRAILVFVLWTLVSGVVLRVVGALRSRKR